MRKIEPIVVDDEAILLAAVAARQEPARSLLSALTQRVIDAYGSYRSSLCVKPPSPIDLTAEESVALLGNYRLTNPPGSLSWLREAVVGTAIRGRCPYCDSSQVTTLDHYLPKSAYAEFSIFSLNLIPACHRCNNCRADTVVDDSGVQLWHAYLDNLPSAPVLFAEFLPDGQRVIAKFRIANPEGADVDVVARVRALFVALKLSSFFAVETAVMLYDLAPTLSRQWKAGGNDAVRRHVAGLASDYEARHGRNTWMTAVAVGLASVEDFSLDHFDDLVRATVPM